MTDMSKENSKDEDRRKRNQLIALPIMAMVSIAVIALAVYLIAIVPTHDARQDGVGADGFRVFQETDADLGLGKVVAKSDVVTELGEKAIAVDDVQVSDVINLNGNRGQTATYNFIRSDGAEASVYIDLMQFRNSAVMDSQSILTATKSAGDVNGHPAYFMHAQTLGMDREYRIMVINGLSVYKFVMTQPNRNITISEVSAAATLKRLAEKANL